MARVLAVVLLFGCVLCAQIDVLRRFRAEMEAENGPWEVPLWDSDDHCDFSGVTCDAQGNIVDLAIGELGMKGVLNPTWTELSTLKSVSFFRSEITEIPPGNYQNLVALGTFDLSECSLTHIDASFGTLPALHTIYLSVNLLDEAGLRAISAIKTLRRINIDQNRLVGAAPAFLCDYPNLDEVFVQFNALTSLPECLFSHPTVRNIFATSNAITSGIPRVITAPNLALLDLAKNGYAGPVPCSASLVSMFVSFNRLQDHDTADCLPNLVNFFAVGTPELRTLRALRSSVGLKDLDVSDSPMEGLPLATSIAGWPEIFSVRAENCDLDISFQRFMTMIVIPCRKITTISVSHNPRMGGGIDQGFFDDLGFNYDLFSFPSLSELKTRDVNLTFLDEYQYENFPKLRSWDLRDNPLLVAIPTLFTALITMDARNSSALVKPLADESHPFIPADGEDLTVDASLNYKCASTLTIGDFTPFNVRLTPSQTEYAFCTCLPGFFGQPLEEKGAACLECPTGFGPEFGISCANGVLVTAQGLWPVVTTLTEEEAAAEAAAAAELPQAQEEGGDEAQTSSSSAENEPSEVVSAAQALQRISLVRCPGDGDVSPCGPLRLQSASLMTNASAVVTCEAGYTDHMCSRCAKRYYRQGRQCLPCSRPTWLVSPMVSFAVLGILGLRFLRGGSSIKSGLFRVLVMHVQLYGSIPVTTVKFPAVVQAIIKIMEAGTSVSVDGSECISDTVWDGFKAPFYYALSGPAIIIGIALIVAFMHILSLSICPPDSHLHDRARVTAIAEDGDDPNDLENGSQHVSASELPSVPNTMIVTPQPSLRRMEVERSSQGAIGRSPSSARLTPGPGRSARAFSSGERGEGAAVGANVAATQSRTAAIARAHEEEAANAILMLAGSAMTRGQKVLGYSVSVYFYLWSLISFNIFRRIFQLMTCTRLGSSDGSRRLMWFLWVECRPRPEFELAVFFGIVYLVGSFAILAYVLRAENLVRPMTLYRAFVEAPYRQEVFFWEVVVHARRTTIALCQVLIFFDSFYLPLSLALILAASLVAHAWVRPFARALDNIAETVSLSLLFVAFLVTWGAADNALVTLLFVANFVFMAAMVILILSSTLRRRFVAYFQARQGRSGSGYDPEGLDEVEEIATPKYEDAMVPMRAISLPRNAALAKSPPIVRRAESLPGFVP